MRVAIGAGCLIAVAAIAVGAPAPALASEEHCPDTRGNSAVVDWGINSVEQVGAGFGSDFENAPQAVAGLSGVTQVKSGFKFGLALLGNCTLRSWGSNSKGQLGNDTQQTQAHPVTVAGLSEVKEIAVANAHAMALLYNGTVWTWGASEFGERGNREKGWERTARQTEEWAVPRDKPIQVPNLTDVKQIAAGGEHDYALLADGDVMAWGNDEGGQLGIEESGAEEEQCYGETHAITPVQCSAIPRPVQVAELGALTGVERIAAGEEAAYAIRSGGREVLAWGPGAKGQLGNGATKDSSSPVRVSFEPSSPVDEIAAGGQQALARLADGEVYAWGGDASGQLGFEAQGEPSETCGHSKGCSTVPAPVITLNHIVALGAGEGVSLALKEEEGAAKVLYSFGASGHYELLGLGDPSLIDTSTPTPVEGLASVAGVSASTTTAVALVESGAGRTPALSVKAAEEELTAFWSVAAESYKVRDRPVGTREFSRTQEGTCKTECSLQLKGLRPQPYEVTLKTPEGKEGAEKTRKIIATPIPPKTWPMNTAEPTIGGSPATETGKLRQGQTLTVSQGSWTNSPTSYAYEWLRCTGLGEAATAEEFGTECEAIAGATGTSYAVQSTDVSRTLIVRVEAKNAAGWSAAVTSAELILASGEESEPPTPTPNTQPKIEGVAVEGEQLTAEHGSWESSPTAYEDKWYRCKSTNEQGIGASCASKPIATGKNYTPVAADDEQWLEVQEKAENPGGWEISTSQAVQIAPPAAPVNVTPPTIDGTIEQGQTLAAHEGTWTNAASKRAWQWLRCEAGGGGCVAIAGASRQTYTLGPEDVGHTIEVGETVENGVGRSQAADSAASAVVPTPPNGPPEPQGVPTITGTTEQGRTLTGHSTTWTNEPKSFAYEWKRCESDGQDCRAIGGASGSSYVLVAADVGKAITLKETASNASGTGVVSSAVTSAVAGAVPVASAPPTIKGNAQEGQALSEYHGTWSGEPSYYSYQWQTCNSSGGECEAISGATGRSYVSTGEDVGGTLRVEEVASNATGHGTGATSTATARIAIAPPVNSSPPTASGTGAEGQTLTAHQGSWSNSPTGRSDQWLRCEESVCRTIEGATKSTYVLTAADVGYSVTVREAAKNAGGWEAADSEGTPVGGSPRPFITHVSPGAGPAAGGTVVTISGGNLAEAETVEFGFTSVRPEIISPSVLKVTAPLGSNGSVDVTVTTPEGTSTIDSASHFTYGPPPSATSVAPFEGPEAGGTEVTITGTNLEEATDVKFGSSDARSFGVQSSTSVTAVAPAGTGTVGVTVKTPYGTTTSGGNEQFTYVRTGAAPVVSKLSAKKGPAGGTTKLMITGTGFTDASSVDFGSTSASFTFLSATSIYAEAPPGTAGTVDVTVATPFGTSAPSTKDHFKYEKPTITSVTPAKGLLTGGTMVTVTGTGFAPGEGATELKFGRTPGSYVECIATTECTVIAPAGARLGTVEIRAVAGGKTSAKVPADQYGYD